MSALIAAKSDDPLRMQWCCLTCFAKFPMARLFTRGGVGVPTPGNDQGLNCPECRSMAVHPADGKTHQSGSR